MHWNMKISRDLFDSKTALNSTSFFCSNLSPDFLDSYIDIAWCWCLEIRYDFLVFIDSDFPKVFFYVKTMSMKDVHDIQRSQSTRILIKNDVNIYL